MTSVTRNSPSFFRSILPHRYFWLVLGMIVALAGMMIEGETYLVYLPVFAFGGFWLGLTLGTLAILIQRLRERSWRRLLAVILLLSLGWAGTWGSMRSSEWLYDFDFLFFRTIPLALLACSITSWAVSRFGERWRAFVERIIPHTKVSRLKWSLILLLAVNLIGRFIENDNLAIYSSSFSWPVIVALVWTGIATALIVDLAYRQKQVTQVFLSSAVLLSPTIPLLALIFRQADDFREVNYPAVGIWGGIFVSALAVFNKAEERTAKSSRRRFEVVFSYAWSISVVVAGFAIFMPLRELSSVAMRHVAYNENCLTRWHLQFLAWRGHVVFEINEDDRVYHPKITLNQETPHNILRILDKRKFGKSVYLTLNGVTPDTDFKHLPFIYRDVILENSEITLSQMQDLLARSGSLSLNSTSLIDNLPMASIFSQGYSITLINMPVDSLQLLAETISNSTLGGSVYFDQQQWSLSALDLLSQVSAGYRMHFNLDPNGLCSFNNAFKHLHDVDQQEILRHQFEIEDLGLVLAAPELLLALLNQDKENVTITRPNTPDAWHYLLAFRSKLYVSLRNWSLGPDSEAGVFVLPSEPTITAFAKQVGWAYEVDGDGAVTRLWLPNEDWLLQLTDKELEHLVAVSIDPYWICRRCWEGECSNEVVQRAIMAVAQKCRNLNEIHFGKLLENKINLMGDANLPQLLQMRGWVSADSKVSISKLLSRCPNLNEFWILFFQPYLHYNSMYPRTMFVDLQDLRPNGTHHILSADPNFSFGKSDPIIPYNLRQDLPNTTFSFDCSHLDIVPDDFKAHIAKTREDVVRRLKEMIEQNSEDGQ
jgi:hypothetical protein